MGQTFVRTVGLCLALGASLNGGALAPPPSHPFYFRGKDGKPVVLIGDYTWGTFSDVDYNYKAMFDTLKTHRLNFARVWVY